jgi:integration host factor subunit alpha
MTLTKADIVNRISEEIGFPKTRSTEIMEILLEIIKGTLETGEDLMLDPSMTVNFKCSGKLREMVNSSI